MIRPPVPLVALAALAWLGCPSADPPLDPERDPGVTRLGLDPGPTLEAPDRSGLDHELFVVTSGGAGRAFRVRMGPDRPPLLYGASHPAFYDGRSLAVFGRLALRHSEELGGGRTYAQTRVRMWEEDGLGSGRWIHNHGLLIPIEDEPDDPCGPDEVCRWEDSSGMDLVSIVGDLRGVRVWSGGYTGGAQGTATVGYRIHDRFGEAQDLLRLYGAEHRELVRAARAAWDALPEEQRECHKFDYKSSYLRPAPGGLIWVMHGTAAYESCRGTSVAVEVPAPPPRHGNVDPMSLGEPGDLFHFGPPDVWIEAGPVVRGDGWSLPLPGGTDEDPPLAAAYFTPRADIRPAHLEPLDAAFTALLPVPLVKGGEPTVDGRLGEWKGDRLLLLDQLDNVAWQRTGEAWGGAADASLGIGLRAATDGWLLAARLLDDLHVPGDGPAADRLQVWLRGDDGWVRIDVNPGAEPGAAVVTPSGLARSGELEEDLPAGRAASLSDARAAWTVLQDAEGAYQGMDVELFLPASAARLRDGEIGLRVLFSDGDGGHDLKGDTLIGNAPQLADVFTPLD